MAGEELAGQLAVLNEALQRLEGELARDATWCALQADTGLDAAARANLVQTLEANPVYRAWRNMRDAAAMLQQAATAAEPAPGRMAATLARALEQLPPEEPDPTIDPAPADVAHLLTAEVAAQTSPVAPPPAVHEVAARMTPEEREAFDVGQRATQAVERILAIPVIEPIAPRNPAPAASGATAAPPSPEPEASPAPRSAPTAADSVAAAVPAEAQDLAFLLTPGNRPSGAEERPFLKRLVAEAQALPTKATVLPTADPFMVPPTGQTPSPEPQAATSPEDPPKDDGRKPRLARLLKAWSRH